MSDKAQGVFDLLKETFGSREVAAGILGNIDVETGGSFDYGQKQYKGGPGRGLLQMEGQMLRAYNNYIGKNNLENTAQSQIQFLKSTLDSGSDYDIGAGHRKKLQEAFKSGDIDRISEEFSNRFLRPGKPHLERRKKAAQYWNDLLVKVFGDSEAYAGELEFDLSRAVPVDEDGYNFSDFDLSRAVPVNEEKSDVPQLRELRGPSALDTPRTAQEEKMDFDSAVNRMSEQMFEATTGLTPEEGELGKKKFDKTIGLASSAVLMGPLYALGFEAYRQAKSAIVSTLKEEDYSPLEQRALSELLPEWTPKAFRVWYSINEVVSDIALMAGAANLAKQGALKDAVKTVGQKLQKAGYGEGQVTIPKEVFKQAAKGTSLEKSAKVWVQSKLWKPVQKAPEVAQIGISTQPTQQASSAISVIPKFKSTGDAFEFGIKHSGDKNIENMLLEKRQEIKDKIKTVSDDEGLILAVEGQLYREAYEAMQNPEWAKSRASLKDLLRPKGVPKFTGNNTADAYGKSIQGDVEKISQLEQHVAGMKQRNAELMKKYDEVSLEEADALENEMSDLTFQISLADDALKIAKEPLTAAEAVKQGMSSSAFAMDSGDAVITSDMILEEGGIPGEPIQTIQESPKQKFKEPTPAQIFTSQSRYAELLGVKKMVEPLEIGKESKDIELTKIAHQIDTAAKIVRKSGMKEKEMAVLLNTHENRPEGLTEDQGKAFDYFRSLTRDLFTRMNEVRAELDMPLIPYRKGYFRHMSEQKVQDILSGKEAIPDAIKDKFILVQKETDNPMALKRKMEDLLLEYFKSDLSGVMKATASTALNEIYLSQPLKMFQEMMKENLEHLPKSTKDWVEGYVNEGILKKQTEIDASFDRMIPSEKIADVVNAVLKHFGKQVSDVSLTDTLSAISKLPIYGAMSGINPRQLIRNKFQRVQDMALYGPKYTAMGSLPTKEFPVLEELKAKSLFLKSYSGFEELPVSSLGKIEKISLAPYHWTAVTNVSSSMNSAYHWTADKITNPKNKGLGWADPQRNYTEPKGFFYPSEKETLLKEMEYGAHTAHYSYTGIGMPQIFRYKIGKPITRLMSWWMNHFFMFHREAATRAFAGHAGYDTSKLIPIGDKINYLKYLILGGLILNALGYDKSFLLGVAPQDGAPTWQLMSGLYMYVTNMGDEPYQKKKRAEAMYKIKSSALIHIPGYLFMENLKSFNETKDLRDLLFYKKRAPAKRKTRSSNYPK